MLEAYFVGRADVIWFNAGLIGELQVQHSPGRSHLERAAGLVRCASPAP